MAMRPQCGDASFWPFGGHCRFYFCWPGHRQVQFWWLATGWDKKIKIISINCPGTWQCTPERGDASFWWPLPRLFIFVGRGMAEGQFGHGMAGCSRQCKKSK